MTSKSFNSKLDLPNLPLVSSKYPQLFTELITVYNAINLIAESMEIITQTIDRSNEEAQLLEGREPSNESSNVNKIYMEFLNDTVVGEVLYITKPAGKLAKAINTFNQVPIAICTQDTLAGQIGEAILFGVITVPQTLVPGNFYRAGDTPGSLVGATGGIFFYPCAIALTEHSLYFFQTGISSF